MTRDEIIKGLDECANNRLNCGNCPYIGTKECFNVVIRDALALLKAQEPRVMKVGEVCNWVNSDRVTREPVFIEMRSGICAWIIDDEVREISGAENLTSDLYGKTWRCWTSRPTDELKETVKWDGDA